MVAYNNVFVFLLLGWTVQRLRSIDDKCQCNYGRLWLLPTLISLFRDEGNHTSNLPCIHSEGRSMYVCVHGLASPRTQSVLIRQWSDRSEQRLAVHPSHHHTEMAFNVCTIVCCMSWMDGWMECMLFGNAAMVVD